MEKKTSLHLPRETGSSVTDFALTKTKSCPLAATENQNRHVKRTGSEVTFDFIATNKSTQIFDDFSTHSLDREREYIAATKQLRNYLRLYLYSAFKWKRGVCSFHLIYLLMFLVQVTKVGLLTTQIFQFGRDRANFSSVVHRGHLTLRHLLLKDWDASWEAPPYPPAHGEFAIYTTKDLISAIDFTVTRYFNAEEEAIGYFVRRNNDSIALRLKYFDFPGFRTSELQGGLMIHDRTLDIKYGLHYNTNDRSYTYSIEEEIKVRNLTEPVKSLLAISVDFTIHSVRVEPLYQRARCLMVKGQVGFEDLDNNGQVKVGLETLTTRIPCSQMDLDVTDWILESTSVTTSIAVLVFCIISLLFTILRMAAAGYVIFKTKCYMKEYYRKFYKPVDPDESDLPWSEYIRFLNFLDIIAIGSDVFTLSGTLTIVYQLAGEDWILETLDKVTVYLGVGCVLAWMNILRFFKFHNKFNLLFSTLYGAAGDVFAYLLCVTILFLGFWVCGYIVMGPYHVKFRTPPAAMETLFGLINGDEVYATLANLEEDQIGGNWVLVFSRVYIGAYIAIFTIVVFNILIAIFMSSYEAVKEYYEKAPDERDLSPVELALRRYMLADDATATIKTSMYQLLTEPSDKRTTEENALKREMSKMFRPLNDDREDIVLLRPRTLKAFLDVADDDDRDGGGGVIKWVLFRW